MPDPTFIDATGVAKMLDCSRATFLRRRDQLEADHRFPLPMPHIQSPLKWRRSQVAAWIDQNGLPRDVTPELPPELTPTGGNVVRLMQKAVTA